MGIVYVKYGNLDEIFTSTRHWAGRRTGGLRGGSVVLPCLKQHSESALLNAPYIYKNYKVSSGVPFRYPLCTLIQLYTAGALWIFFTCVPESSWVRHGAEGRSSGSRTHLWTSTWPSPGVPLSLGQEIVLRMKKIINLVAQPVTTFLHQVIYNKLWRSLL